MQITCPCCHARFPLDAALDEDAARDMVERLAAFGGELPRLAVAYLGLFRAPGRVLSWKRAGRLLGELVDAIEAGRVRRQGRDWAVSRAQWVEALQIAITQRDAGRLDLPLKNHAYLFQVAAGLANATEAKAEREAEAALRRRERQSRAGPASAAALAADVLGRRRGEED